MKNWEKYEKEIREFGVENFAIIDGNVCSCMQTSCNGCYFLGNCDGAKTEWLYEEAEIKITKTEIGFCEVMKHGFIARDKDGELFIYENLPTKLMSKWHDSRCSRKKIDPKYFPFIAWGGEPWGIQGLLKLKVEE